MKEFTPNTCEIDRIANISADYICHFAEHKLNDILREKFDIDIEVELPLYCTKTHQAELEFFKETWETDILSVVEEECKEKYWVKECFKENNYFCFECYDEEDEEEILTDLERFIENFEPEINEDAYTTLEQESFIKETLEIILADEEKFEYVYTHYGWNKIFDDKEKIKVLMNEILEVIEA